MSRGEPEDAPENDDDEPKTGQVTNCVIDTRLERLDQYFFPFMIFPSFRV